MRSEGYGVASGTAPVYTRYPVSSVLLYNGVTIAHYLLGAAGIALGYGYWVGYFLGAVYLGFALVQMYVGMPLKVCPNCVYVRLEDSLCISGLNVVCRQFTSPGDVKDFGNRAKGALCPNNLYLAALAIPIVAIIPALVIDFSFAVLTIFVAVVALLAFRFFVIFSKVACVHCRAKNVCPNAKSMKLA